MISMSRCKSIKIAPGGHIVRCECDRGHVCAHYGENEWWPNDDGFPVRRGYRSLRSMSVTEIVVSVIFGLVLAFSLGAFLFWLTR